MSAMTSHPSAVACPANKCSRGEAILAEWRDEDGGSVVVAGRCDSCGFPSVYCQECGEVTLLADGDETQCDGCPAVYQQVLDRHAVTETFRRVS